MSRTGKVARSIFVWTYERGTIQYDIICALILAFIFFVPPSCFIQKKAEKSQSTYQKAKVQSQNTESNTRDENKR